MKRTNCLFYLLALVLPHCGVEEYTGDILQDLPRVLIATPDQEKQNEVVPNRYLVAFKPEVSGKLTGVKSYFAEFKAHYLALHKSFAADTRITGMHVLTEIDFNLLRSSHSRSASDNFKSIALSLSDKAQSALPGVITRVDFRSREAANTALHEWLALERIWYAEPDYISQTNDTYWSTQAKTYKDLNIAWHNVVNTADAFNHLDKVSGSTDDQPIIAVMDSGVDVEHPSIKQQMWYNEESVGASGCLDDYYGCNTTDPKPGYLGNGDVFPHGTSGYNEECPSSGSQCDSKCCHGTHVAGIIAAQPKGSIGGICPICRIMVLRTIIKSGIPDSAIVGALKYVSRFIDSSSPIRVINASFGKFQRSRSVSALIRSIVNIPSHNRGVLVIGAAGNEDSNKRQYPAAYDDALAVANLENNGDKSYSSNFGQWVDVAAPGTEINSCVPGGKEESKTGTSMSAPVVSGIAGLIIATSPEISVSALRARLIKTANPKIYETEVSRFYIPKVSGESFPIPLLGSGMVNALNAVKNNVQTVPEPAAFDRVGRGCGAVAAAGKATWPLTIPTVIFLLAPLCFAFFQHLPWARKRNHKA